MRKLQPHLKPARPWGNRTPAERSLDFEAELKRRKLPISVNVVRELASQFASVTPAAKQAAELTAGERSPVNVFATEVLLIVEMALSYYANIVESEANGGEPKQEA